LTKDGRTNAYSNCRTNRLAYYIFIHLEKTKQEFIDGFGLQAMRITVIPFGINNAVVNTSLTPREAKQRSGIRDG
jgi:hypothetical protein